MRIARIARCLTVVMSFVACDAALKPLLAFDLGHCFNGGCDVVWKLNQAFDGGVRSKSESLVGPAREAFDDSMETLFRDRIGPMIDHIDQVTGGRLSQVDEIVRHAESGISGIIDQAGDVAVRTVSSSAAIIREQIIDVTFDRADSLIGKMDSDLLNIIDTTDCVITGQQVTLQEWVHSQIDFLPHPFDSCYTDLGFVLKSPGSDDLFNIYKIRRCQITKDLDSTATVGGVLDNYARLSVLARRFSCAMRNTSGADRVQDDADHFGRSYELWHLASKQPG